jgi:phthiocerol/phenolphthiocerol synthesis type-I polyketide synthase B
MTASAAIAALDEVLRRGVPQVAVVSAEWPKVARAWRGPPDLLSELCSASPATVGDGVQGRLSSSAVRATLASLRGAERDIAVAAHVRAQAARVLGAGPIEHLDASTELAAAGLDSLLAVELRGVLEESLGCDLPATLLQDYGTIDDLTRYVSSVLESGRAP